MSKALDSHPAIRPSKPDQQFWAILAWQGLLTVTRVNPNVKPTILRYLCKEAREIVVSRYIKTFVYYCHASNTWDIHEVSTGARISGGGSITDAFKKAQGFLKDANEGMFFEQMKDLGSFHLRTECSYDQAMLYLQAGEDKDPALAKLRRRIELSK